MTAVSYSSLDQSLMRLRSCKSSELISSFMKRFSILLGSQFGTLYIDTFKLGMKQGLGAQTKAERQGGFPDSCKGVPM